MLTRNTITGAFLLGMGVIGMLDGIVFHQLLQWHSTYMYTDRYHQVQSDGWLHLMTTFFVFAGAWVLWRAEPEYRGEYKFWGGLLLGAGFFNLVEGIINHHLLQIHHVRYGTNQLVWDLLYDAGALTLLAAGYFIIRSRKHAYS